MLFKDSKDLESFVTITGVPFGNMVKTALENKTETFFTVTWDKMRKC